MHSWREFVNDYVMTLPPEKPTDAHASGDPQGIPGLPGAVAATGPAVSAPAYVAPSTPNPGDSTVTNAFIEKLKSKYATSPLYPVIEQFTTSLESLGDFIPEEGNRFRAALKQLKGIDSPKLAEAYQSLIKVLEGEATKFSTVLTEQRSNEIGSREATIKNINSQIETKNNEMKSLMEQRDTVAGEIVSTKTKLDTAENSFEGAVATLRGQLEDSVRKVTMFLPSTATTPATK